MKIRNLCTLLSTAVILLSATTVEATIYQGTVLNVATANGAVYIYVGNGAFGGGGAGSCSNGSGMVYAIQTTPSASDFNKAMIALAITAKTTGLLVYASGDGNCVNGNPYNGNGYEALAFLDLKG